MGIICWQEPPKPASPAPMMLLCKSPRFPSQTRGAGGFFCTVFSTRSPRDKFFVDIKKSLPAQGDLTNVGFEPWGHMNDQHNIAYNELSIIVQLLLKALVDLNVYGIDGFLAIERLKKLWGEEEVESMMRDFKNAEIKREIAEAEMIMRSPE